LKSYFKRLIRCTALKSHLRTRRSVHRFEQDSYHGDALPTELTGPVFIYLTWAFAILSRDAQTVRTVYSVRAVPGPRLACPLPVVAPAELRIAHTGRGGGPAAGRRSRLVPGSCHQAVTERDGWGYGRAPNVDAQRHGRRGPPISSHARRSRSNSTPPQGPRSYFIAPESPGRAITYPSISCATNATINPARKHTVAQCVRQVDLAQTDRREQRCRDEREPGGSHGHGGWPRSCAWEPAREAIPPVRW
jgi:hypothetical protein